MAAIVMKNARIWTGDATDPFTLSLVNPVEIKGVRSVTLDYNIETAETTTFGEDGRRYIPGLVDGSGTIEVLLDTTGAGNYDRLLQLYGKTFNWIISPTGAGSSASDAFNVIDKQGYGFRATLTTRVAQQGTVGDVIMQNFNFKVDGSVWLSTGGSI